MVLLVSSNNKCASGVRTRLFYLFSLVTNQKIIEINVLNHKLNSITDINLTFSPIFKLVPAGSQIGKLVGL